MPVRTRFTPRLCHGAARRQLLAPDVVRAGRLLRVLVVAELERVLDLLVLLLAGADALLDERLLQLALAGGDSDRLLAGRLDGDAARRGLARADARELTGLEVGEGRGRERDEDEAGEEDVSHARTIGKRG